MVLDSTPAARLTPVPVSPRVPRKGSNADDNVHPLGLGTFQINNPAEAGL